MAVSDSVSDDTIWEIEKIIHQIRWYEYEIEQNPNHPVNVYIYRDIARLKRELATIIYPNT